MYFISTYIRRAATALLFLLLALSPRLMTAQVAQPTAPNIPADLRPYYLALFRASTDSGQPPAQLLQDHLAYMRHMTEQKRYVFYGPSTDGGNVAGMIILIADSLAEARTVIEADPMVRAGRLTVALHAMMLPALNGVAVRYPP